MAPYAGLQGYEIYENGYWTEIDSDMCSVVPWGAPFLILRASRLSESVCPALAEFVARYTAGVASGVPLASHALEGSDAADSEEEAMA